MIVVKWESERDEGEQNVDIVCCCTWNEQMNTQISSRNHHLFIIIMNINHNQYTLHSIVRHHHEYEFL